MRNLRVAIERVVEATSVHDHVAIVADTVAVADNAFASKTHAISTQLARLPRNARTTLVLLWPNERKCPDVDSEVLRHRAYE
jgi:hypothetical protein